jgi:hypothetical protein
MGREEEGKEDIALGLNFLHLSIPKKQSSLFGGALKWGN